AADALQSPRRAWSLPCFFQAEDGIRDDLVTGVQTCALPIWPVRTNDAGIYCVVVTGAANSVTNCATLTVNEPTSASGPNDLTLRSEERRVGKEGRAGRAKTKEIQKGRRNEEHS